MQPASPAADFEPEYLRLLASGELARRYSKARNYVEANQAAVREMHRQVGDLVVDDDDDGIARRGLLLRPLLLPEGIAGTDRVLAFLAGEISRDTYVNLMDRYCPRYRADEYSEIDRPITNAGFREALAAAERLGLTRIDARPAR